MIHFNSVRAKRSQWGKSFPGERVRPWKNVEFNKNFIEIFGVNMGKTQRIEATSDAFSILFVVSSPSSPLLSLLSFTPFTTNSQKRKILAYMFR